MTRGTAQPEPGPAARGFEELGAELRAWVDEAWDVELSLREWRARLADAGWACPSWPRRWGGRDLPAPAAAFVGEELARLGLPGPPDGVGLHLAVPTLLEHGSAELKDRLIPPTVTGDLPWCQLFSEPAAGSDLAGLLTTARPEGGRFVVRGQKVWTTSAHHAAVGLLLARTDWDAPKHAGITAFALPMRQPGVEVRPLRQMNGHASFNEVFLDGVVVDRADVIGEVGGGWRVARTTLAHERRFAGTLAGGPSPHPTSRAGREALEERAALLEPYRWYPQRAGRADLVEDRARHGGDDRAPVRQQVAGVAALARTARWTAQRAAAARARGQAPGPEGSIGKLAGSELARRAAAAHSSLSGAAGMLRGSAGELDGVVAEILVSVPAVSIAGGTDEIQRSILGERVLGLPREPVVDQEQPFRQTHSPLPGGRDHPPGSSRSSVPGAGPEEA